MEISKEIFEQQRHPRFGKTNPERMQLAFWKWMVRGSDAQSAEEQNTLGQIGLKIRAGKLKSFYGPYLARDLSMFQLIGMTAQSGLLTGWEQRALNCLMVV